MAMSVFQNGDLNVEAPHERAFLEVLVYGRPVLEVVEAVCRATEAVADGFRCGIYLIDWSGPIIRSFSPPERPVEIGPPARVSRQAQPPKPFDKRRLARVMEFIDSHSEQSVRVADLASVACMSQAHFARSFKATTGQAPSRFISKMRLERAKRMLAEGRQPMTEIALSAGFSSHSNFTRAFRTATGATPREYRRTQIGSQSFGI